MISHAGLNLLPWHSAIDAGRAERTVPHLDRAELTFISSSRCEGETASSWRPRSTVSRNLDKSMPSGTKKGRPEGRPKFEDQINLVGPKKFARNSFWIELAGELACALKTQSIERFEYNLGEGKDGISVLPRL